MRSSRSTEVAVEGCSVARGPRFFKWKMRRESGPYALLFLQLLIALMTWSLVTIPPPLETSALHPSTPDKSSSMKCLPSLEVVN